MGAPEGITGVPLMFPPTVSTPNAQATNSMGAAGAGAAGLQASQGMTAVTTAVMVPRLGEPGTATNVPRLTPVQGTPQLALPSAVSPLTLQQQATLQAMHNLQNLSLATQQNAMQPGPYGFPMAFNAVGSNMASSYPSFAANAIYARQLQEYAAAQSAALLNAQQTQLVLNVLRQQQQAEQENTSDSSSSSSSEPLDSTASSTVGGPRTHVPLSIPGAGGAGDAEPKFPYVVRPGAWADGRNLIVTNLPMSMDEDSLKALFTAFGAVTRVHVVTEKDTQKSRGFGFVEFEDTASTLVAIEQSGKLIPA
eukprot:gene21032-32406_t